jgi:hypothetical protein
VSLEVAEGNVVPGAHPVAVVDRHRAHRRMRKHETDARRAGEVQFVDDGDEVIAVGAEAVHPDHGGGGVVGGFEFDCFEGCGHE